ncbi:MAG: stage III sporulation protein AF [Clostridia bacterium]
MIDIFKNWISAMLGIGIFITFIQLILPKTNLKKYIYSLVGIVTILTVVAPVINIMKNKSVEQGARQVIDNISGYTNEYGEVDVDKYREAKEVAVKEGFVEEIKKDVKEKLTVQGVAVESVDIFLNQTYDIEKIEVKIAKQSGDISTLGSVNSVVDYINKEYDIAYSKIVVIEEGT